MLQRMVNGLVWIACGIIVIALRTLFIQSANILAWELIGAIMISYGAVNLVRAYFRGLSARKRAASTENSSDDPRP